MAGKSMFDRFIQKNPLAVMTRCLIEELMDDQLLDQLFEENRCRQYFDTIRFSAVAMSMADIALGTVENRNQAYHKHQADLNASLEAYYGKLNRTEPSISEAMVRYSAERAHKLMCHLDFQPWEPLAGYRCRSLDGNHLQKTDKRLTETRGLCAAPLPGTIVARYDHQTGMLDRAYLLEDAHAQESTVLDRAAEDLFEGDLVIADRHFCIVRFMRNLIARGACFLIRQHGRLKGKLLGKRRRRGRIDSGVVYEQALEMTDGAGTLVVRRITVELDKPTRDGDVELHILSNVPAADANACELAKLYRQRWEIENAFHTLTMTMNCESKSNCHPRCALFQFCMAMFAFNCRQVMQAALYAEHEQEDVDQMSQLYVAMDMVSPMDGMTTAINEAEFQHLMPKTLSGVAQLLRRIAKHVNVKSYRKSVRGPKRTPPRRKRCKAGAHVSVHRVLEARKQRC